ncbi:MAG: ATP-binding cassette domain-containing protein, partial [Nitrososphaerales archaeon]
MSREKATQPIVSLSGGELLLLNYAKARALLPSVPGMVACSPVYWLNHTRYTYWDRLVQDYQSNGKYVDVLLLDGEPFPSKNSDDNDDALLALRDIQWYMEFQEPEVLFDEIEFPSYHPASTMRYFPRNALPFRLSSPTLLTGDNGVGKSILAKILSGIIKPHKGRLIIKSPNGEGNARLLFQDSIDQLFGKSIDDHLDWVFRFDGDKRKTAKSIYDDIDYIMRVYVKARGLECVTAVGEKAQHNTLLQAKISLIAERLASVPPLLILDEPGWGLPRPIARNLVLAACEQAHKHNVAVLIIS